jgi:hypothetical protein
MGSAMRASLSRDGREVGVFNMTRDGEYSWDCHEGERERFDGAVTRIIQDLREPSSWSGGGAETEPRVIKPGDPRWFDRVLARLQNKGYEHVVLDTD